MAVISGNYFKVNLENSSLINGVLVIDYTLYESKSEREREKFIEFTPFDLTYYENQLKMYESKGKDSLSSSDISTIEQICKQMDMRFAINRFFRDKLYLSITYNYDKDFYYDIFRSVKELNKYIQYLDNPIKNTGSGTYIVENYTGKFDLQSLYSELKKYMTNPIDDL